MTDAEKREKVIKGLECCATMDVNDCDKCPYLGCSPDRYCFGNMAADAFALLKAQEPVKPNEIRYGGALVYYQCPNCTSRLSEVDRYCAHCGRKVKWE